MKLRASARGIEPSGVGALLDLARHALRRGFVESQIGRATKLRGRSPGRLHAGAVGVSFPMLAADRCHMVRKYKRWHHERLERPRASTEMRGTPRRFTVRRCGATWVCSVLAPWLGCQASVNAVQPPPQPLEAAAAREVTSPHPDNCLAAWPVKQTLEGRLLGIVLGPFPEEDTPAKSFLFLLLDDPISVCASPENRYPAYEDVTRIKVANLSPSDFGYAMHTWGADQIRIKSTLNAAQTIRQEPGPVIFDTTDFQFCWRPVSRAAHDSVPTTDGLVSDWTCMDSTAWFSQLPGPHL